MLRSKALRMLMAYSRIFFMKERKKIMKIRKILAAALCIVTAVVCLSGCGSKKVGTHHVEINVKDRGTISVELDGDTAPITVQNFLDLANEGFYDGLTFHRIIDGFMIQGGDPNHNGTGGSEKTIKGEFSSNGVKNSISHTRGTISMARSQDMDSASSQFFIMQADATYLDGNYAGFGHVTSGLEIVDAICKEVPVTDNNGSVDYADQPVIESIKVID